MIHINSETAHANKKQTLKQIAHNQVLLRSFKLKKAEQAKQDSQYQKTNNNVLNSTTFILYFICRRKSKTVTLHIKFEHKLHKHGQF